MKCWQPKLSEFFVLWLCCCESWAFAGSAPAPSFENDVQPLLKAKCYQCHSAEVKKGELSLDSVEGIRKGSESGAILIPGDSAKSVLFQMVHKREMPPDDKQALNDEQVEVLRRWIDAGAGMGPDVTTGKPDVTQHDVIPILLLRCTACHGRQMQEADLDLRSRMTMLRGGRSGPAFVPGNPDASLMLKRIRAEEMPPRKQLTDVSVKPMEDEEFQKLVRWIELGAPESPAEQDLAGTEADPLVTAADQKFWSFQPPHSMTPPNVGHGDTVRNPLDSFVLQKLEDKGLSLSPETDRLTLIRRVTFDLTGLPPEPEDVESFLSDHREDAYEKLVDRLLASSRYGERWGRHWLDVAGYADCEGRREQHLPRPFAWRYRDYVIRSFNSDKSYDRFLQEQLAGDDLADYEHASEITQEMEDNLVATAFLRMAPDPTWANLTGFVPDRLEVMADVIDVIGSGLMGLTMKCAQCHSHKFDPIPQRDYYRLVALFKGAYDEHDWLKPELNTQHAAKSVGFGERYLPHISSLESGSRKKIQEEMATLTAGPQSPEVEQRIAELKVRVGPEPRIMALWDRGDPSPTYLYRRGDYKIAGPPVPPGPPAVVTDRKTPFEISPPFPESKSTGRRLAFARWLTRPENPLTARVMVNRIWKYHFGVGLLRSLGNFGNMGDRPTHPEMLDWLACEFIQKGFSVKSLHRLVVTSHTYRQRSAVTLQQVQLDPDNRLLSRMPMRRMEAESLRDTLLLIAGQLNDTEFGPAEAVKVRDDGLVLSGNRRSIYVQQLRRQAVSLLEIFDLPSMNPNCLQRPESLVAPQALHLMNDAVIRGLASQFADRAILEVGSDWPTLMQRVFAIALSRPPSGEEQEDCVQSLQLLADEWSKQMSSVGKTSRAEATRRALATVCHTIINSATFLYID